MLAGHVSKLLKRRKGGKGGSEKITYDYAGEALWIAVRMLTEWKSLNTS